VGPHQWYICESCNVRNCKVKPKKAKGVLGGTWICDKYRKHREGWKLAEVAHQKRRIKGPIVLVDLADNNKRR